MMFLMSRQKRIERTLEVCSPREVYESDVTKQNGENDRELMRSVVMIHETYVPDVMIEKNRKDCRGLQST